MKKITKLLLMTAIAIGMVACSNDDVPEAPESAKGNTYASISISLPKTPSTRGLPEDYNKIDEWKGIDLIKTINVFLVNSTANTVDVGTFTKTSFEGLDDQGVLFPNVALKATAGNKVKAYIVLNGDESAILGTLESTAAGAFDGVFNAIISEVASNLAKNDGTNDIIMMTNTSAPAEMNVKAGVTESQAMTGSVNTFFVDVERVVSRAIVTVKDDATLEIPVLNAMGTAESGSIITIEDLKYVVGQSNKQFYMIKQDQYKTPETVYNFVVPTADDWLLAVKGVDAIFDNEGLENLSEVKTATGADDLSKFKTALEGEKAASKFVLPVTHKTDEYKKGNTTYFEVIATFTPNKVDGEGAYTPGSDVFMGMKDGKFYTIRELAEAQGQKATHYKGDGTTGAIMKYVLWLNPDKVPGATSDKATMSPTVRNQVYHAHITGFKQIGLPNNPLNPEDTFTDPLNPGNPIRPEDPLQTEDTYLSVVITVVPWGVHSYEIELGNDY